MAILELNWRPDRRQLTLFTLLWFPLFMALVGWIVFSRVHETAGLVIWGVGLGLALLGLLWPPLARAIYVGSLAVTAPIGFVVAHVVLAVVFYGLFTPIGLIARLFRRDPLRLRRTDETSYFVESRPRRSLDRYFRQY